MSGGLLARFLWAPAVYEMLQSLTGGGRLRKLVLDEILSAPAGTVLDLGSGTGWYAGRLPEGSSCICLDSDPRMLRARRSSRSRACPLLADVGRLPLADRSVDTTIMTLVGHHLDEGLLESALDEAARVTRRRFIFLDALAAKGPGGSSLLWKLDRGSFPRQQGRLEATLGARFRPLAVRRVNLIHEYLLWTGGAASAGEAAAHAV